MKHTWKAALAVVAIAATAGAARADVTLDGQTGLFINPTAQVAAVGQADVEANYQHASVTNGHANQYGIGGAYGIADKLEISADYEHTHTSVTGGSFNANTWRVGGKYQIFSQSEKGFALAVGGNFDRTNNSIPNTPNVNHWNAYVAGTKSFDYSASRAPIQATLGLRYDHFNNQGAGTSSSSRASVYAGADVPLSSDGSFSLVGEVGSKVAKGLKAPYALGLRWQPKGSPLNVGVGFGRPGVANSLPGTGTTVFAQVGYSFGK